MTQLNSILTFIVAIAIVYFTYQYFANHVDPVEQSIAAKIQTMQLAAMDAKETFTNTVGAIKNRMSSQTKIQEKQNQQIYNQ